jgi:hypothetical protein
MERAHFIRDSLPPDGLFAGQSWRIAPEPFPLDAKLADELQTLGRVLLQFYRAANLLYRQSVAGKQPAWVAQLLDQGKPAALVELQRHAAFKNEVPRVIRPDLLLTSDGFRLTELDSVPGGIGLTAWLNATYSKLKTQNSKLEILGGARGMIDGFASIFGDAKNVHLIVSEESASYRPEMEWLAAQTKNLKLKTQNPTFTNFADGDAIYRFFELFDLANVANAPQIFALAAEKKIHLTPPPKPIFEEKLWFALFWNRHLQNFWRQELGDNFFSRLKKIIPYTWVVDPTPLPPHAALPRLELTDWTQLKTLSQRDRELILKISGYSPRAWGARGVSLGSDLAQGEWAAAVDEAIASFPTSPFVLQTFEKPKLVESAWFDFEKNTTVPMQGRARLCPYYFVAGEIDSARPTLGGVLATICPADKKIIHGMTDAILAPCAVAN